MGLGCQLVGISMRRGINVRSFPAQVIRVDSLLSLYRRLLLQVGGPIELSPPSGLVAPSTRARARAGVISQTLDSLLVV